MSGLRTGLYGNGIYIVLSEERTLHNMGTNITTNRVEDIFRKLNPDYLPRYQIYDNLLSTYLNRDTIWLDIGCGCNEHIAIYGNKVNAALGIDITIHPERTKAPFLQGDLRNLPLPTNYADLITLRMVVEHLDRIPDDLSDIVRVLKPNGIVIILTTNILSPVVFLPYTLPYSLKAWLISKIFKVVSRDVFPVYHKFNTPNKIRNNAAGLQLVSLEFLEHVPTERQWLTVISGTWYLLTKLLQCQYMRSNILAVLKKNTETSNKSEFIRKD